MILAAGLLTMLAILLGSPPRLRALTVRTAGGADEPVSPAASAVHGGLRSQRLPLAALAGGGVAVAWGGSSGLVLGVGLATVVWVVATRAEPAAQRRLREQRARQLPDVVSLLALALGTGVPVAQALDQVQQARPGPAADALASVGVALGRGVEPAQAWAPLLGDPALARLARGLIRSAESGSPVAEAVARVGAELATERRMAVADRARAVGVKAALPLGVCLLPAFLLVGIVPLVAVSISTLPR